MAIIGPDKQYFEIMGGSRGGTGGSDPPPEKSQKYRVS